MVFQVVLKGRGDLLSGLDGSVYKWSDANGKAYDPIAQNVLADKDAFKQPFMCAFRFSK